MRKKILVVGMIAMMVLSGCGGKNSESVNTENSMHSDIVDEMSVSDDTIEIDMDTANEAKKMLEEGLDDLGWSGPEDGTGRYVCASTGAGVEIDEDMAFVYYIDYENKSGKSIGVLEKNGNQAEFKSPGFEDGAIQGENVDGQWMINGEKYEYNGAVFASIDRLTRSLCISGTETRILANSMKSLAERDIQTNVDLEHTMVASGDITQEITITTQGAIAYVKAINPYENEVSLEDCEICYFYTEDQTDVFTVDGYKCGEENHDQLLENNVKKYEKDKLVYQCVGHSYEISSEIRGLGEKDNKGAYALNHEAFYDNELTLYYNGENPYVLQSFSLSCPDILYNGMNNNMDTADLESMTADKLQLTTEVRDNIMTELMSAFSDKGIDVDIDKVSGEIAMKNDVLFGFDSYELSEEGKQYINQFFDTYGSVLLSDKFKDYVSEIKFEGYTDSSGSYGYNMTLSQKRAEAVRDYCLDISNGVLSETQQNMLKEKATAEGFSWGSLVLDENGDEDAEASRRVMVKFYVNVNE